MCEPQALLGSTGKAAEVEFLTYLADPVSTLKVIIVALQRSQLGSQRSGLTPACPQHSTTTHPFVHP